MTKTVPLKNVELIDALPDSWARWGAFTTGFLTPPPGRGEFEYAKSVT